MKAFFSLICIPLLMSFDSIAQISKVDQTIKDASPAIQTIGGFFKKKKKDDASDNKDVADNNSTSQTSSASAGGTNVKISQTKVGSIAANAKYLDVDQFFDFSYGLAAVKKGNSEAFIDKTSYTMIS